MQRNSVKILHCADLHLGSSFSSLENIAAQRSSELLQTFNSIINICKEQKIDFLLIAGDLFDKVNVSEKQVDYVIEMFLEIPDTYVVISPGNHDPFSADSFYMLKKWPENVCIFKGEMSDIFFKEKNVRVYGAGFTGTYSKGLFEGFLNSPTFLSKDLETQSDTIEICVIHGDLTSGLENSLYNPITLAQIARSGFDYIALGHIHKRTPLQRAGKTYYAYPGPPEGRGFDETGEMGIYIGTISKGSCDLEFLTTSKRNYSEIAVNVDECKSEDEIFEKVTRIIKHEHGNNYQKNFYKIILKGEIPPSSRLNINLIQLKLSEMVHYIDLIDNTRGKLDLEKLSMDETLKGIYARKLLSELMLSQERNGKYSLETVQKAIKYGMQAFDDEVLPDEYKENTH